jgi:hypothetical protein
MNKKTRLDHLMAFITLVIVGYASYELIFKKLFECFMGLINPMCPRGF